MSAHLTLDDLRRADESQDPDLVKLLAQLAEQPDEEHKPPLPEGALTFDTYLARIRDKKFRAKPLEEQAQWRIEIMKALEAPDAEVPLPARIGAHEIIYGLWKDDRIYSRGILLEIIATVPLVYGPWRALKQIFKEAEAQGDSEILGALAARFDMAFSGAQHSVSKATLGYLCRRGWRYLRRTAESLPICYADVAVDFLAGYTDDGHWQNTWIANHVLHHETKKYDRKKFKFGWRGPTNLLKNRAYSELWRRSPRPLFSLLERAKSEHVRQFAANALKADFRSSLREVEPEWVVRLVNVRSDAIDEFVVWILDNVPRFEQSAFRELGLHDAVLRLFDSDSSSAQNYAAKYARTHARDLPVNELVRLANHSASAVYKLALDLIQERDPRKEIGLEAWGQLLETDHGRSVAEAALRKHFGASELTPKWFKARLFTNDYQVFNFIKKLLPQIHPFKKLGPDFFCDLIDSTDPSHNNASQILHLAYGQGLSQFDLNELDVEFLKRVAVHPFGSSTLAGWID
ncbi:MAG: hypothetical protein N2C14_23035, partial [Planctomycetales bacterium]